MLNHPLPLMLHLAGLADLFKPSSQFQSLFRVVPQLLDRLQPDLARDIRIVRDLNQNLRLNLSRVRQLTKRLVQSLSRKQTQNRGFVVELLHHPLGLTVHFRGRGSISHLRGHAARRPLTRV